MIITLRAEIDAGPFVRRALRPPKGLREAELDELFKQIDAEVEAARIKP